MGGGFNQWEKPMDAMGGIERWEEPMGGDSTNGRSRWTQWVGLRGGRSQWGGFNQWEKPMDAMGGIERWEEPMGGGAKGGIWPMGRMNGGSGWDFSREEWEEP